MTPRRWLESTAVLQWKQRDLDWAQRLHHCVEAKPWLLLLAGVSWLSDGVLWYVLIAALMFGGVPAQAACAVDMAIAGLAGLLLYLALKHSIGRPRPFVSCNSIRARARVLDQFSFPSGHSLHAVSFAVVLGWHFPWTALLAAPFAVLVALSRVMLGLHYPSDVLAGLLLGSATALTVLSLF